MSTANYTSHSALAYIVPHLALVEDFPPLDPAFKGLPWLGINGHTLRIPRIASANAIINVAAGIASGGVLTGAYRTDFTWADEDFPLKAIATDRILDDRIVRELSDPVLAEQRVVQAGIEAVLQRFSNLFINGVAAADQFDGLGALVSSTMSISSTASAAGTFLRELDQLLSYIQAGDGIATAIIAHPFAIRRFQDDARATGNMLPALVHPVFGLRLHYAGVPILPNHHIEVVPPPTEALTDVYAVQFGIGSGVAGIFPARNGEMGARVEKRHDDDSDVWYYKIKLECGLALYRESAVGRIKDLNVTPFYVAP